MTLKNWLGVIVFSLIIVGFSSCKIKDLGNTNFKSNPDVLETVGTEIPFSVTGEIDQKAFPKKTAVQVNPFFVYGKNHKDTIQLEPVILRGEKVKGEGQVISYANGGAFSYTNKIQYTGEEMNNGELKATLTSFSSKEPVSKNMLENCIKCKLGGTITESIVKGVIHTDKEISVSALDILIAQHYYVKEVQVTSAAKIFYPVNRSEVNITFDLNKNEAAKKEMKELFDFMSSNYVIKGITVNGWASPEGEGQFNDKLAENRAKNAENYFRKAQKENLRDIGITANGKGSNWDGFVNNIRKAQNFKAGNTVLNNINSKNPSEREGELRKMINQYPEIKKEFLPDLRYAEIIVTALEPRHSDGELKELATAKPESLKVEELLYAATLFEDMNTKEAIYKSTSTIYPENWNALNNYASVCLTKGDYDNAEKLLTKANTLKPNQPEVLNNLGIVAAHKGDYAKAEDFFKKAEQNSGNVAYNKAVLGIREGQYSNALSAMTKRSCDYNLALTQVLSKNYNDAQKTLECAQKDSQTYYLMSVLGARKSDKSMVIDNLKKAIALDASIKNTAAKDAEFIKYQEDADFNALIK